MEPLDNLVQPDLPGTLDPSGHKEIKGSLAPRERLAHLGREVRLGR